MLKCLNVKTLMFSHFFTIFKKEVKELVNKQFVISLIFTVLLLVFLGNVMQQGIEETKEIKIALLDLDGTETSGLVQKLLSSEKSADLGIPDIKLTIIAETKDLEEAIKIAEEKDLKNLILIPSGFENKLKNKEITEIEIYTVIKGFSVSETVSSAQIEGIVQSFNRFLSQAYLQAVLPGENIENILNPVKVENFVMIKEKIINKSPAMVASLMTSQGVFIPIVLMMVIIYTGTMMINSMSLEKENKTLETLLTLPIKRTSIIIGKIAAAAVVGLLATAVYMIGFNYYMQPMTSGAEGVESITLEDLGLEMGILGYLILGISLFLTILVGLSLAMLLGVFSEDTKSAQTMVMPIIFLAMVPIFLLMVQDIEKMSPLVKIILYIIPFSHPVLASRTLIFGNFAPAILGIFYLLIILGITLFIILWIFNTDKILTAKFSFRRK